MTQRQFEKFANGIISGLQTMQDLRNNKSSLLESYPQLGEDNNWDNLVIFARNKGLTPICNHIRVARTLSQVMEIFQGREIKKGQKYDTVGAVKHWAGLINAYCKIEGVTWDFRTLKKEWATYVASLADKTWDAATRDYNYNSVLKAVSKLVFQNPTFQADIITAISSGILDTSNPAKFVQNWYTHTDSLGNLLVKVPYISKDNSLITNKWECRKLTTKGAVVFWEVALGNLKKCYKAGKEGRKFNSLKKHYIGECTGEYWNVITNDKGKFAKGEPFEDNGDIDNKIFTTTLQERNKELSEE